MKRSRLLVSVVVTSVLLWSLLAWGAAHALIVRKELEHADSIVVLAGSATYEERVRHAAQLFKEGRAPRIILTNDNERGPWSDAREENPLYVELAAQELQRLGIPSQQIEAISPLGEGTRSEALRLRDYAEGQNLGSLLVVTSAYHSRRALWILRSVFEGSNIVVGLDPVPPGQQTPLPATWWFHPRGWLMVPTEYAKMVYYWLRFR